MTDAPLPVEAERPGRFQPPESVAGAPFWSATRDRRYVLPWCTSCGHPHWFPREFCPTCLGTDLDWREASGEGVVDAVSVMPKPGNPLMAGRGPYAVALVALPEGVRVMAEVVADDPDLVAVGQAVRLEWEALADGRHLPVFRTVP